MNTFKKIGISICGIIILLIILGCQAKNTTATTNNFGTDKPAPDIKYKQEAQWTHVITVQSINMGKESGHQAFIFGGSVYMIVPENAMFRSYKTAKIKKSDPATFEENTFNHFYFRDKNHVYYFDQQVEDADPHNFRALGYAFIDYGTDQKNIFYENKKIVNADPMSFTILIDSYSRDKNHIYYENNVIAVADVTSWKIIDSEYSKDLHHIFWKEKNMANIDPSSFVVLDSFITHYIEDKNGIYFDGEKIEEADRNSFELIENVRDGFRIHDYAKDKNHLYYHGKIVNESDKH